MLKALDDKKHGTDLVILDARGHDQYTGQVRRYTLGKAEKTKHPPYLEILCSC